MDYQKNYKYFKQNQLRDIDFGIKPLNEKLIVYESPELDNQSKEAFSVILALASIFFFAQATVVTVSIGVCMLVLGIFLIIYNKMTKKAKLQQSKEKNDKARAKVTAENKKIMELNDKIREENMIWNNNIEVITDADIDSVCESFKRDFKVNAFKKIGITEQQVNDIEPIQIFSYYFDKLNSAEFLQKKGDDGKTRSSNYHATMFIFLTHQIIQYDHWFSLIKDVSVTETTELSLDHIVSIETVDETDGSSTNMNIKVNSTIGECLHANFLEVENYENSINKFREFLRNKKNE